VESCGLVDEATIPPKSYQRIAICNKFGGFSATLIIFRRIFGGSKKYGGYG